MPDLLQALWPDSKRGRLSLAAGLLVALGTFWQLAGQWATHAAGDQAQTGTLTDHETRLRTLETDLPAIRSDVSWIRQTMEEQH